MPNFDELLKINQNALDKEWINQPSNFMQMASQSAITDAKLKRAKENITVIEAEAYTRARNRLEASGEKITEALIKATMVKDKVLIQANEEYNVLYEELGILKAGVEAFQHKKSALENLVKLHLAGYFSSPADIKQETKLADANSAKQSAKLSSKFKKTGE